MKFFLMILIALCLSLSAFAQTTAPKPQKRIAWSSDQKCVISGFADDKKVSDSVSCGSFLYFKSKVMVIRYGGMTVSVSIGNDGQFLIADTFVSNNSYPQFAVGPELSKLFAWKHGDGTGDPELLEPISGEKAMKEVRDLVELPTSGSGGRGAMLPPVPSSSSNRAVVVDSDTADPNTEEQIRKALSSRQYGKRDGGPGDYYALISLKPVQLAARQSTSGMIYFKRTTAPLELFTIKINDVHFDFPFSAAKR